MQARWVPRGAILGLVFALLALSGASDARATDEAGPALQLSVAHAMSDKLIVHVTNVTDVDRTGVVWVEIRSENGAVRRYAQVLVPARSTVRIDFPLGVPYVELVVGITEGPDPIPR